MMKINNFAKNTDRLSTTRQASLATPFKTPHNNHQHTQPTPQHTTMLTDTFLNPFTDFGFKRLFGEEANKHLLASFLNAFLPEEAPKISTLTFSKNEFMGEQIVDRQAIFDIYCQSATGERFIVELQKAQQNFFKDRSVYYASFAIQEQGQKGKWNFELTPVYAVGILDFIFNDEQPEHINQVVHTVRLKDEHNLVFYPKLTFIYLTLPNFKKTEHELLTMQDKWLYAFKNLADLDHVPPVLQSDSTIADFFETAKIAAFGYEQRHAYERSLKYYRDLKNTTDFAIAEGREEGREEGIVLGIELGKELGKAEGLEEGVMLGLKKAALKMHRKGTDLAEIAEDLELDMATVQAWILQS